MKKSVLIIFITLLIIPIISFGQRVTYKSAYAFMKKRSNNINQKLIKGYSTEIEGTKTYFFFTVPKVANGQACVSMVSEYKLEVFSVDCKSYSTKQSQWLDVGGPRLFPSDVDLEKDIKLISDFNQKTFKNPKERWDEYVSNFRKLFSVKLTAAGRRYKDKYDTYFKQYKQYLDKEIGISINEIFKKGNIKSLPNLRNTINNDVYSDELKNNYLSILEKEIKSYNDSIISLFTSDLENKKTESLVSYMESLIEYKNIDSLQNNINDKFEIDKPFSFTNTERFKEYFVDFIINKINSKSIKVYNGHIKTKAPGARIGKSIPGFGLKLSEATMKLLAASAAADEQEQEDDSDLGFMVINFELKGGEIKTSTSHKFLNGHTIDYTLSEDEKTRFENFKLFNITPKIEPFTIKKEVKLVTLNKTFIHNRKEPLTLYVNKNLLEAEERSAFRGGVWTQKKIFFKSRSNDTEPITTKTFESQKNQIKLNLNYTYGLKVKKLGSILRVDMFENLNSYFNSANANKPIDGYFSKNKKIVNVYTEWVYELYIGSKKVNKLFEPEFEGLSPLNYLSYPPDFNKPFYTIDVYQIF